MITTRKPIAPTDSKTAFKKEEIHAMSTNSKITVTQPSTTSFTIAINCADAPQGAMAEIAKHNTRLASALAMQLKHQDWTPVVTVNANTADAQLNITISKGFGIQAGTGTDSIKKDQCPTIPIRTTHDQLLVALTNDEISNNVSAILNFIRHELHHNDTHLIAEADMEKGNIHWRLLDGNIPL